MGIAQFDLAGARPSGRFNEKESNDMNLSNAPDYVTVKRPKGSVNAALLSGIGLAKPRR